MSGYIKIWEANLWVVTDLYITNCIIKNITIVSDMLGFDTMDSCLLDLQLVYLCGLLISMIYADQKYLALYLLAMHFSLILTCS